MPETPLWLLSRNRHEDALKSLQWLRGWVNSDAVQKEFNELQLSRIDGQTCYKCQKQNEICQHPPPSIIDKIRDLFRKRTLCPFLLIGSLYFLSVFCGITAFRPYIVQVLYFYQSPIDANQVVVWLGYIGFVANLILVCTIRKLGKRLVYLWSLTIVVLTLFTLGKQLFEII